MEGKHYEEFEVGDQYISPWRYISETDLRQFITLTGLAEPLFESRQFLDEETDFDTWIVPGFLTVTYALGLFNRSNWFDGTGLAMLEAKELSFEAPVKIGNEIRAVVEVTEKTPTSSDRGGIVKLDWTVETEENETVVLMTSTHFIKKQDQ